MGITADLKILMDETISVEEMVVISDSSTDYLIAPQEELVSVE